MTVSKQEDALLEDLLEKLKDREGLAGLADKV
jgi:hypothetical protein